MVLFHLMQEKGDIDLAIRYYLVAIEVCMHSKSELCEIVGS